MPPGGLPPAVRGAPVTAGRPIRVGSRGSPLALIQDDEVISRIRTRHPGLEFEVVAVRTSGDANQTAPLAGMGLGVFVSAIEERLLSGELDMAVHSLKDVPTRLPEGLTLGAIVRRRDARDVLVNRWNCPLEELPEGARIGTSSPRRAAQLRRYAPQVEVVPIRGNVETRLRKAAGEEADGAVLAAAGLLRMGMEDRVADYLSTQRFVPPPGQGALAVEVRSDDRRMLEILGCVEHPATRFEVTAERAFLETLGGGCSMPVGAYARSMAHELLLTVFLGSPDGSRTFTAKVDGLRHDPRQLASDAYLAVAERGGADLLQGARQPQGPPATENL